MSPTRPVWLGEDEEIFALLNAALDYFDGQPSETRQRPIFLPAEKHLGSLASGDAEADQLWRLVCELERVGVLTIREAKRSAYDPEWKGAKLAFAPASEEVLREWLTRERVEPAMQQWRRAVLAQAAAFPSGCDVLLTHRIAIPGRDVDDIVKALGSIAAVKGPITLRQLSATTFWGDSKVLDNRGELITALFPHLEILPRTLIIDVYLRNICRGVLFIENQDTYAAAAAGVPLEARELALVYSAGFRSTAARVRSREGALLHYAGPGLLSLQGQFDAWWYDGGTGVGSSWFWGDLDFAGMQILKSLRSRFEDLSAWRPGYEPMLEALRTRGGYKLARTSNPSQTDLRQTDPGTTGCPFADETLLPVIRRHGQRDQESVTS